MTIKETNVTLHVADLDRSIAYYEALSFSLKKRWGNYYAQLEAPGICIGLHPSAGDRSSATSNHVSIGFTVADFKEAEESLVRQGVVFTTRKEEGGQFLHFNDPDGTLLYVIKPAW